MDGLRAEQNTWRVLSVKDGWATLRQRMRQPDGSRKTKLTKERPDKLLGGQAGKINTVKGALVIPDNFGIALLPGRPVVVPFHKVYPRLRELRRENGGKWVPVLRNGHLIQVSKGGFKGTWRVVSAKNNSSGLAVDMGGTDVVRLKNKTPGHKINVLLSTLLKDGLQIVNCSLTGVASCPTTSSA